MVGSSVIGIETVRTQQDVEFSRASATARRRAPVGRRHLDDAWLLHHLDGLGRGERSHLRVWVAGWNAFELVAFANVHVGVELLGSSRPGDYRGAEFTACQDTKLALSD